MSRLATAFVLGYHGCDRRVAEEAIAGRLSLLGSDRAYDWLGPGVYFWEADPQRALEWAKDRAAQGQLKDPAVLGAVIDLGNCLDLGVRADIEMLVAAHDSLIETLKIDGSPVPENRDVPGGVPGNGMLHYLDCAVIRRLHEITRSNPDLEPYGTVRGLFQEGDPAYPGSSFRRYSHRQIAVVNPATCIKGLFWAS